jgi:hypothetical protein
MASFTKVRAANHVISLLGQMGLDVNDEAIEKLKDTGFIVINNYQCRIINIRNENLSAFQIRVNNAWFKGDKSNKDKLFISTAKTPVYEYTLIPTKSMLYVLHYLDLRKYCFQLEKDLNRWFNDPNWGMKLVGNTHLFKWAGGNTKDFPLELFKNSKLFYKSQTNNNIGSNKDRNKKRLNDKQDPPNSTIELSDEKIQELLGYLESKSENKSDNAKAHGGKSKNQTQNDEKLSELQNEAKSIQEKASATESKNEFFQTSVYWMIITVIATIALYFVLKN